MHTLPLTATPGLLTVVLSNESGVEVPDLAAARRAVLSFTESRGMGYHEFYAARCAGYVSDDNGITVARISYNGRLWDASGTQPLGEDGHTPAAKLLTDEVSGRAWAEQVWSDGEAQPGSAIPQRWPHESRSKRGQAARRRWNELLLSNAKRVRSWSAVARFARRVARDGG